MDALGGVISFAALVLVAGPLARLTTQSGRRLTLSRPLSLDAEVKLNAVLLVFAPVVVVASGVGMLVGYGSGSDLAAWAVAAVLATVLLRPGQRLVTRVVEHDLAMARPRRRARYPHDPALW